MTTIPFTMRLDETLKKNLEEEARREDRSASYLATRAIKQMLDAKSAKRLAIEEAMQEADAGAFVSQSAVHKWMDSWDTDNELPSPAPDVFHKKS